jgi:hypothetical protein
MKNLKEVFLNEVMVSLDVIGREKNEATTMQPSPKQRKREIEIDLEWAAEAAADAVVRILNFESWSDQEDAASAIEDHMRDYLPGFWKAFTNWEI